MSILTTPTFLVGGFLAAFAFQMFLELTSMMANMPMVDNSTLSGSYLRLQSHSDCGMTSKGREECWWKCMTGVTSDGMYYFQVSRKLLWKQNIMENFKPPGANLSQLTVGKEKFGDIQLMARQDIIFAVSIWFKVSR